MTTSPAGKATESASQQVDRNIFRLALSNYQVGKYAESEQLFRACLDAADAGTAPEE